MLADPYADPVEGARQLLARKQPIPRLIDYVIACEAAHGGNEVMRRYWRAVREELERERDRRAREGV